MRTILIVTLSVLFSLSSCQQKTYTCVCTGGLANVTNKIEIKAKNRSKAENECNAKSTDPSTDGLTCQLQ